MSLDSYILLSGQTINLEVVQKHFSKWLTTRLEVNLRLPMNSKTIFNKIGNYWWILLWATFAKHWQLPTNFWRFLFLFHPEMFQLSCSPRQSKCFSIFGRFLEKK